MKQRLIKLLSLVVFLIVLIPFFAIQPIVWVVIGGKTPFNYVDNYFNWLIKDTTDNQ